MLRRELFLRMARGERLIGSDLTQPFYLGSNAHRDMVPAAFLRLLIEDGFVTAEKDGDALAISITPRVDDWFLKRGVHLQTSRVVQVRR